MSIVTIRKRIVNSLIVPLTGAAGVLSGIVCMGLIQERSGPVDADPGVSRTVEPLAASAPDRLREAFRRIAIVESGGDPQAVGLCGEVGIVQIMPIVVDDVNRILGRTKYGLADRRDVEKSWEIFRLYCRYYYPDGSIEQWARLWHRGPNKASQYDKHGDAYWAKVKAVI